MPSKRQDFSSSETVEPVADRRYLVDSVVSACALLRAFEGDHERAGLRDLAARTGLTPSRAFRLLRTLEYCGLVERVEAQRYRLRVKALERPAYRIAYAGQTADSAFAREVAASVRQAAAERNVQLIEFDNRYSAAAAVQNAERMIRQRVNLAIEFQTFSSVAAEVALKFREAGIPLIAIDIAHPGAIYFGADNYRAGLIAGQELAKWISKHWDGRLDRVLLLDIPAAGQLTGARLDGALAGLRRRLPAIDDRIVIRLDGRGQFEGGLAAVRGRVRPDQRTAIVAANDPSAIGGLRAAEEAGCRESCVAVSQGASSEGREELRQPDSRLIGSVGFFPERYGERLLELAAGILEGQPAPPAVFVEHEFITRANVDRLYPGG